MPTPAVPPSRCSPQVLLGTRAAATRSSPGFPPAQQSDWDQGPAVILEVSQPGPVRYSALGS